MAAHRMAARHALFGLRLPARSTWPGDWFQIFSQAKNSILSFLDVVLCSFAPVEFPHGPLERRLTF